MEPNVMSKVMKSLLKENTAAAFSECVVFNERMRETQKEIDTLVNDFSIKYPTQSDYYKFTMESDNLKLIESEIDMLNDALQFLTLKKQLMIDQQKESGNLFEVLRGAVAPPRV